MDYIKSVNYQLQVVSKHRVRYIDEPFTKFINQLLNDQYTNIKTLEKIMKRKYQLTNKIPLWINDRCLLMCIQSYRLNDPFYINYFEVLYWEKNLQGVIVFFRDGYCVKLNSYTKFYGQIVKIDKILKDISW